MEFYESFMKFCFADDDVFCIEKDPLVTEENGIKACESIVLLSKNVALIEAKASSPKEICGEKFNNFITDIKQKFADSLRLFNEVKDGKLGEAAYNRLPVNLRNLVVSSNQYLIYLIIHGHKLEWLGGLQDAFREALREVVKQWNLMDSKVKVYNEEMALENHLIVAYIPKDQRDFVREKDGSISYCKMKEWFDAHK